MSETLLPHNATAQERAIEAVLRQAYILPVPFREVWDPDTCSVELLPWLAFALSVDVWNPEWAENTKREVIRRSFEVHRHKGARKSVETALEALGFNVDLSEWFEHGGDPHTFRIDAYGKEIFEAGYQLNAGLLDEVTRLIETVKPARTHFDLRVGESFNNGVEIRSGARAGHLHKLETDAQLRPALSDAVTQLRTGFRAATLFQISHDPTPRTQKILSGSAVRSGVRVTVICELFHDVKRRAAA